MYPLSLYVCDSVNVCVFKIAKHTHMTSHCHHRPPLPTQALTCLHAPTHKKILYSQHSFPQMAGSAPESLFLHNAFDTLGTYYVVSSVESG